MTSGAGGNAAHVIVVALLAALCALDCSSSKTSPESPPQLHRRDPFVPSPPAPVAAPVDAGRPAPVVASVPPVSEKEPNDTFARARRLPFGKTGFAAIATPGDRDGWRIEIPAKLKSGRYRFFVANRTGLKLRATLTWAASGRPFAVARAAVGEDVFLRYLGVPASPSTLYVVVSAAGSAASPRAYGLRVTAEPVVKGALEREPNDTARDATPLDREVKGVLDRPADRDHFAVNRKASAGAVLSLQAAAGLRPWLALKHPDGRVLRRTSAGPGRLLEIRGERLERGRTVVLVGVVSGSGAYTLRMTTSRAQGLEREPNDARRATGVGVLTPGVSRAGWIHPRGDRDYWRFSVSGSGAAARRVSLRVEAPDRLALRLQIYREDGLVVATNPFVLGRKTVDHALVPGVYHVRVQAAKERAMSSFRYTLKLAAGRPQEIR